MDSAFWVFSEMGIKHITDFKAYDHMLFVTALCAIYRIKEWRKVAILVTAFTIGHSATLALSALDLISFPKDVIETLIPITIVLTCIYNIYSTLTGVFDEKKNTTETDNTYDSLVVHQVNTSVFTRPLMINYVFAFFFGLIHGMGFSNYFKAMADEGDNFVWLLFSFNVGIEGGQLMIVAVILTVAFFVMDILKIKQKTWNVLVSSVVGIIAFFLIDI